MRKLVIEWYPNSANLQEILETELETEVHTLNGENNEDLGYTKRNKFYSYVSAFRTLWRLVWFLEFLTELISNVLNTTEAFDDCADKAYDRVFSDRHGFWVRSGAAIAIKLAPSDRKVLFKHLCGLDEETEESRKRATEVLTLLNGVVNYFKKYYKDRDLEDIPYSIVKYSNYTNRLAKTSS